MAMEPSRIEAIVADVLSRLDAGETGDPKGRPLGVHASLDEAVAAARKAFEAYRETPVEVRARIIAAIRQAILSQLETISKLAVEETGLGRVSDKILKNKLVAEKTPGTEDLEPHV